MFDDKFGSNAVFWYVLGGESHLVWKILGPLSCYFVHFGVFFPKSLHNWPTVTQQVTGSLLTQLPYR